jgi:predicted small lipoprotein YifL
MRRSTIVIAALVFLAAVLSAQARKGPQMMPPKEGYVPDEQTAVKVSEAVLTPIYGVEKVIAERPFHALLNGDVWTVEGTVRTPNGGAAVVKLHRSDGRITLVTHGK